MNVKHKINYLLTIVFAFITCTALCQSTINTNNSQILANSTLVNIYSKDFRVNYTNQVFKKYLIYNTTRPEVLYVELLFYEYLKEINKFKSFYKLNVFWFMSEDLKNETEKGIFYGVSNSKIKVNNTLESDLVICRLLYDTQKRCDDYYMVDKTQENIINSFYSNFKPTLDSDMGHRDSILTYEANWLLSPGVNNYKTLIKFSVYLSTYVGEDLYDLDLDFRNNLTIFYGFFTPNENKNSVNFYDPADLKFNISKISTINYTEIITTSSNFRALTYSYLLINLIFILI
jgi:hypothetical protein